MYQEKFEYYYFENPFPLPQIHKEIITSSEIPTKGLNEFNVCRAKDVASALAVLLYNDLIKIQNLRGKIIDFGCGSGASSHVLKQYGGNVVGVDNNHNGVKQAIKEGILTSESSYIGDGFEYLNEKVQPASIDLLSAFRIMRDLPIMHLYDCANRVLKRGGQLLITGQYDSNVLIKELSYLGKFMECISEDCLIYTKP
jgi:SAM-dependent methyltransferase